MTWFLVIKTSHDEHEIAIGPNESDALSALDEAQAQIGKTGVVRIVNRLTLKADDILSAQIKNRYP
jgi:hypothetical protein